MIVILEGPDAAGKSTLAKALSEALNMPIAPGEGPAISEEEINSRMIRFLAMDDVIFDRHPAVSQAIYNNFRKGPSVADELMGFYHEQSKLIIYCVGSTITNHVENDKDERVDLNGIPHKKTVQDHYVQICAAYNQWAIQNADLCYSIGNDIDLLTRMVRAAVRPFDPIQDIISFHRKFDLEYDGPVRALPREIANFRKIFMTEELNEYSAHDEQAWAERENAINGNSFFSLDISNYNFHLEHQLDAFVDLVYVVFGTAYLQGMLDKFPEAWRRVHKANMKKIRAPNAESSTRKSTFDVIKPKDWEAPRHIDLVEQNDLTSKR